MAGESAPLVNGNSSAEDSVPAKKKEPAKYYIHSVRIFQALFALWGVSLLLMVKLFSPALSTMAIWTVMGLVLGMAMSYMYFSRGVERHYVREQMNTYPGIKGLRALVGGIPSWVTFREKKNSVEWLNRMLEKMWPFYDIAVCRAVKETVEPIMEQYRPPGVIKKLSFKQLTFGDAPFRVESIYVNPDVTDHVEMEIDVRWAGEANIVLSIELPAGGEFTRMTPRVTDLSVVAQLKIQLHKLVDEVPGFGAAVVSMKKPPLVKFSLNFGKALGGSLTAKPVIAFLDPFLRETLTDMLVWPNRVVVPILDESVTGPLADLELRNVGVLRVKVLNAQDLKQADMGLIGGKADPKLEFWTQAEDVRSTSTKHRTLEPEWNETLYVLVQEPRDQIMKLVLYDVDVFDPTQVLRLNVVRGIKEAIHSKSVMARSMLRLEHFTHEEDDGQDQDHIAHFGLGEWANDDGPGTGEGFVNLKLAYLPFAKLEPVESQVGAVLVHIVKGIELAVGRAALDCQPYVLMKCDGQKKRTTTKLERLPVKAGVPPTNKDPANFEWNEQVQFTNVRSSETIKFKVFDDDTVADDLLGEKEIYLADVAESLTNGEKGVMLRRLDLDDSDRGVLIVRIQYVPMDW